jgi:hypothetical protein
MGNQWAKCGKWEILTLVDAKSAPAIPIAAAMNKYAPSTTNAQRNLGVWGWGGCLNKRGGSKYGRGLIQR